MNQVTKWCQIKPDRWEGFTHAGWLGMGILKEYRSLERVELSVFASNLTAIHLYEKFDFETEGLKKKARKLDGTYDDIIIMALIFD